MGDQHRIVPATLGQLGAKYGSDKFWLHHYENIYEQFLGDLRDAPITLLEIGIGEEDQSLGGASLLTWAAYLSEARIVGIDLYDKSGLDTDRISTRICDQSSSADLDLLSAEFGPFDVIIDDGSHVGRDVNTSLFSLFPALKPGGLYVIEDLQTSYWPPYGGSTLAPMAHDSAVRWLKFAIDIVNRSELLVDNVFPLRPDLEIQEVHVFHNLAVLRKNSDVPRSSAILTDEVRHEYAAADELENGGRAVVHDALISNPAQFGLVLDRISELGGVEAFLAASMPPAPAKVLDA